MNMEHEHEGKHAGRHPHRYTLSSSGATSAYIMHDMTLWHIQIAGLQDQHKPSTSTPEPSPH